MAGRSIATRPSFPTSFRRGGDDAAPFHATGDDPPARPVLAVAPWPGAGMIGRLALTATLSLATAAAADGRRFESIDLRRVDPGETVARTVTCDRGEVAVGGGWRFTGIPDDQVVWLVHDNYPTDEGAWRFVLQNVSARTQPLRAFLYVFCREVN
jgi:hypothetical protein